MTKPNARLQEVHRRRRDEAYRRMLDRQGQSIDLLCVALNAVLATHNEMKEFFDAYTSYLDEMEGSHDDDA
jgi:hypothetical protein